MVIGNQKALFHHRLGSELANVIQTLTISKYSLDIMSVGSLLHMS